MTWPNDIESIRNGLLNEGYCVFTDHMSKARVAEFQSWSDRWLAETPHPPEWKYQGSDIHVSGVQYRRPRHAKMPSDPMVDFLIEHPLDVMKQLRINDFVPYGHFQIISKPPNSPPLYWHQDWARWGDPISLSPWPQQVFLNWYLSDTTTENGCLRVIPGSHRHRLEMHSHLVRPHEGGGYHVEETNEWMFHDHPQAIDVAVSAGSLVIGDARLLHGTHANSDSVRRTVLLGWFFRRDTGVPDYWTDAVPEEILNRDPETPFVFNREPGEFLRG